MIKCYFSINEDELVSAGENSGGFGLDENSDTYYILARPHKNLVFHATPGAAMDMGLAQNHNYVCEARFTDDQLITALNCAFDNNVEEMHIMIKEIAEIKELVRT